MAQSDPLEDWQDDPRGVRSSDWQALREDLMSLLDQVDARQRELQRQSARRTHHRAMPGQDDARRLEALRSVQDAVDRFADAGGRERADYADQGETRAVLQSAIDQIRERTGQPAARAAQVPAARSDSQSQASHGGAFDFGELTGAIAGIGERLGRLEQELQAVRGSSANLADISAQVAQLSEVVEMLAGAVGETGQVKRLESQIGNLAKLVSDGPRTELSVLTHRIDEVAATIDRFADMQLQQIEQAEQQAGAEAGGQAETMRAIETGVRNIYDRLDTLEKNRALDPDDFDRLSRGVAEIARALSDETGLMAPGALQARFDTLNERVAEIGSGSNSAFNALHEEIHSLAEKLATPDLSAIEARLDSLGSQLQQGGGGHDSDFERIEAQIRQLSARMDETGQQLGGLAELFSDGSPAPSTPDLEQLATELAHKTAEQLAAQQTPEEGIDAQMLDVLEARLSRLLTASAGTEPGEGLDEVRDSINEVNQRLARLEVTLSGIGSHKAPAPAPAAHRTFSELTAENAAPAPVPGKPVRPETRPAMDHAVPSEPKPPAQAPAASASEQADAGAGKAPRMSAAMRLAKAADTHSDTMPQDPLADTPLRDTGFVAQAPAEPEVESKVEVEVEVEVEPEAETSGEAPVKRVSPAPTESFTSQPKPQTAEAGGDESAPARPHSGFDPERIERPAKPQSSLVSEPDDPFATVAAIAEPQPKPPTPEDSAETVSADRNTFIAAARRAVQRHEQEDAETRSLIGRAFSRLNKRDSAENADTKIEEADTKIEPEAREAAAERQQAAAEPAADDAAAAQSFLVKNSRVILLSAAVVAVCLLTVNLIVRRSGDEAAPTPPAVEIQSQQAPTDTDFTPEPMLDPQPTGSIDPFTSMEVNAPQPNAEDLSVSPQLPAGTRMVEMPEHDTMASAQPMPSPVLELPPETLGPLELRQAAADGDPRAQFEIAAIYMEGQAVARDMEAAANWLQRSAAQGFAPAQYRLGNLYEHGDGVAKDAEQAQVWYERAAELGNRMAMHNLAALYASGALGSQQFSAAAGWFARAAARGMTDSQFNLGMLYARGLGVPQDMAESYKWFSLAANNGDADAARARDDVARSLDAETMLRVQDQIQSWTMAPIDMAANFAPIGTWSHTFNAGPAITDEAIIKRVQLALGRLGYDVGTPDGVMGPKTSQAIKSFERATGMNELGIVNPRLLAILGSQPV